MFDYIVVGAGSAGAVLASRLTEDPAVRVLLLEAGTDRIPAMSRIPAGFSKLFDSAVDWNYRTEPEPELAGRSLYWPRGRMLGGSSAMNAMIWTPPTPADLDEWAAHGNPGWGWADVAPTLARIEVPGDRPRRPGQVGISIDGLRTRNPVSESLLASALALGIPANDGFVGGAMDGAGFFRVTQARGARVSAATGYLDPVRKRPNLTILANSEALRIRFEGRRAVGVDYRQATAAKSARGKVILAAGAIGSPHLLMVSGVGPAADLERHRVPVVADLPGVGGNLQDHPACGLMHHCREAVTLADAERIGSLLRYLALRRGPLTSNVAEAGAFLRLAPGAVRPDIELIFAPTFFVDHGRGNPPGHGFTVAVILLRPASRGRIRLRSADPGTKPAIEAGYLTEARDLALMEAGFEQAMRVADGAAVARWRGAQFLPAPGEPIGPFIRQRAETLYHPVGTCRMGPDAASVVSPTLRVHGTEDLWVADASIMPTITSGHPHAPVVMLAEHAARLIPRT